MSVFSYVKVYENNEMHFKIFLIILNSRPIEKSWILRQGLPVVLELVWQLTFDAILRNQDQIMKMEIEMGLWLAICSGFKSILMDHFKLAI